MVALASRLACWPRLEAAARPRSLRMSLDRSSASGSSSSSSSDSQAEGAGAGGGGAGASAFGSSFFGSTFFGSSFFGDTTSGLDAASEVSFMRSSLVYVMGSEPSPSSMLSARGATSEAGRADRGLAAMAGAIAARRVEIETREGALGRTCARVDATSAMRCGAGRVFRRNVERRGPLVCSCDGDASSSV